jgi:hypothetical protein
MDFREAEQVYRDLENRLSAGQISLEAYRQALAGLRVVDASGATWQLQERTGRWFVYQNGQWVEPAPYRLQEAYARPPVAPPQSTPYSQPVGRPPAAYPIQSAPYSQPYGRPPTAAPSRHRFTSTCLIIVGILALCGILGGGGALLFGQTGQLPALVDSMFGAEGPQLSADAPATSQARVKTLESLPVTADGAIHRDAHGVGLSVPKTALPANGQANLAASEVTAPWRSGLEKDFSVDTPFYNVAAQGKNDSAGDVQLSFPAASPGSRLMAVIDSQYLVELAAVPKNGKLSINAHATPSDLSAAPKQANANGEPGSIYYTVITPKSTSSAMHLAAMVDPARHNQYERNCIPGVTLFGSTSVNMCRQNEAGTIQVMFPAGKKDLQPQVDQMVDNMESVMKKYAGLGFTAAALSTSSPLLVVVSTRDTSPAYVVANGVLYIPVEDVARIASSGGDATYHEMGHWIEAKKYSMFAAYLSGEKTWWMEAATDNMVMLVDPAYVGANLNEYGKLTLNEKSVFQLSPYQWPFKEFYVQAQLVKLNICDNGSCPLTTASFAQAVSSGTYPLMDAAKKSQVGQNLPDYARYLLGKRPVNANSSIPLSGPVKTGEGYGEYVSISRTEKVDVKYDFNGTAPQMRPESKDGKDTVVIEARLQADSVYPLVVKGAEAKYAGVPAELVIEPGPEFYYTLDDGEAQYSNGLKELTIRPIHPKMGYSKVRLVAYTTSSDQVFKAKVQPLDLEGAWVVFPNATKSTGGVTCTGGDSSSSGDPAMLMPMISYIFSGLGDMKSDPTGRNLDWSMVPARLPKDFDSSKFSYEATALLSGEAIRYQAKADLPEPASNSQALPPAMPLAAGALVGLPACWFGRRRLKNARTLFCIAVLVVLAVTNSGCVGFGMAIYGNTTINATFTKVEYQGGTDTGVINLSKASESGIQGKPIWKLTGTATYDVNTTIETEVTTADGKSDKQTQTCSGKMTLPVYAMIYKDVVYNTAK